MPDLDPKVIARAYQINREIKALQDEYKDLMSTLDDLTPDKYVAGDYVVVVTPNRRFDEATAKRNLPPHLFDLILKPKPDSGLAKANLEPDEYALCQRDYGVKKEIKRVEDGE